jgi:membrane fusion protein, multidrug efflux system
LSRNHRLAVSRNSRKTDTVSNAPFALLVGILLGLTLTACSRSMATTNAATTEGVPVRVAVAVLRDVPLEVAAVGNVEAINRVDVKPRIAGQIERVALEEGQSVRKGQLLFTIDSETLQRQAAEQQAELERDLAMEQQARALVARDTAAGKQSQSEANVGLELAKEGIVARQRAGQLLTANETAEAALRSDQAAVEAAAGTVKADHARLAQTQLQLSFVNITAPISGRAGAVMVQAGNVVRDNDSTLVTLLQLAPIHVTFGVPEQILPEIQRLNASGRLAVEASNDGGAEFEGRLAFIDNAIDASNGMVRLKADFANTDKQMWPGQFVNVRLRLRMENRRTLIPESAIQDGQDGEYVWLVKSGLATTMPVTELRTYKPARGPEQAVVGSGVRPGDTVVTEGQLRLTPGAAVRY